VAARLRARRQELVATIFARVRGDAFDRAGEEDAEYVSGLRETVLAALEYVLEGIERGNERADPIPLVACEQARRAARVGVPLDTVLRRYVVGSALLGEFIMEEADRSEREGDPVAPPVQREALREALRAQASRLDRLLQAITIEYGDELARAGRSPEQRRAERVRRLLAGGVVDGGAVDGAGLDYELEDCWHLGVIAVGARAEQAVRELAVGVDCRCLIVAQDEQSVWAWLGGREPFVVGEIEQAISAAMTREEADQGVVLALGEPARGLEGWRLTHRQAQAALVVALRRPRPFTRYADVALLASALKDDALARALIDIYLSPLEDSRGNGPVLRETLRAYLAAERSVSSAAVALGVVRKTVESRLRAIEEKLGRTLHPCPAELEVALLLDELSSQETVSPNI
jgi:hypothetical protein